MDINCTEFCEYQSEGKCGLNEVPHDAQKWESGGGGCPYRREKGRKLF